MRKQYPIFILFTFLILSFYFPTNAQQVRAGISANGNTIADSGNINVCTGSNVTFQSMATGTGTLTIKWTLTGANIPVYVGSGPFQVKYATAGSYTVLQSVTNGISYDTETIKVTVSSILPMSAFTWTPDANCGNIPVQFTNASTGTGLSYLWTFEDDATSKATNPSYQFLNAIGPPGTQVFPVTLTATNSGGCSNTIRHSVTVQNTPDASIGNGDPNVSSGTFNGFTTFKNCANLPAYTFSFTNLSGTTATNTSYTFEWGDGSPNTTYTAWPANGLVTHTFPLGSNTMTVTATGSNGCIGIKKYNVFLGLNPSGGLSSPGNTQICTGSRLTFDINNVANNPPGTQYTFQINDGSPAQTSLQPPPASVSHTFLTESCGYSSSSGGPAFSNAFGAYLTISNPCGTTSPSVVPIYVSGKPRAMIATLTPSNTVCLNSAVTFQNISTGRTITPTGGYNSTCTPIGGQVWVISPGTGYTISGGNPGSFNGSPSNGLQWTPGSDNLSVNFTATGTYAVKLYVYNSSCGMDSTIDTVCIRNPPQASFTMSSKTSCGKGIDSFKITSPTASGCQNDEVNWQINYSDPQRCTNGQGKPYQFLRGTDNTSLAPVLEFDSAGIYVISLTVGSNSTCAPATMRDTFIVIGPPRVSIAPLNPMCPGNVIPVATVTDCYQTGPLAYQWNFVGTVPGTSQVLVPGPVNYPTPGIYPVQIIVTDSTCHSADTAATSLTIIASPVANTGNDTTICSGDSLTLGSPGLAGVSYQWTPSAGLSNAAISNPVFSMAYTGPLDSTVFKYAFTASAGAGCASTDSIKITVNKGPSLSVTPGSATICLGSAITNTASGADIYNWQPAAGLESTNSAIIIASPVATTTYQVKGALLNGCADSSLVKIIVDSPAIAKILTTDTVLCTGSNLDSIISAVPYLSRDSLYNWYINGTFIGSNNTGNFPSYLLDGASLTDTIQLVSIAYGGCNADSMVLLLNTYPAPVASFNQSTHDGCGPLTVNFLNNSTSDNSQYYWVFGNGQTSTLTQPGTVVYSSPANYNDTTYYDTLKVFNGCTTTIMTDSVKVFPDPKARFNPKSITGCSPFNETISNLSSGDTSYWNFGDGQTLITYNNNPVHHIYHTGAIEKFSIQLIEANKCGRDTMTDTIVVSPSTIVPKISLSANTLEGCAPFNARFVNSSSGAALIIVDFGDNTPAVTIPGTQNFITHTYNSPGVYFIKDSLINSCADTTIIDTLHVYAPPLPAFSINTLSCTDSTIFAVNSSVNSNSFEWVWGDGDTTFGQNPTHAYTAAGSYSVSLTASLVNNLLGTICSVASAPQIENVFDIIPAQIDTGNNRPCVPYNLTVTAAGAENAKQILWIFYDASTAPYEFQASGQSASYQFTHPGNYKVKLIVTNAGGCQDSVIKYFEVYATPKLSFTPFGNLYTCNTDTTLNLSVSPEYPGRDPLTYNWYINGQDASSGNPFVFQFQSPANSTAIDSSLISAVVENSIGCRDSVTFGSIIIRPLPRPVIVIDPPSAVLTQPQYTFNFSNSVNYGFDVNYLWNTGDQGITRSGKAITYQYGDTGRYTVRLQVMDEITGCINNDSAQVIILYEPGFLYVPDAICPGCSELKLRSFLPIGKGLKQYRLRIFNTWGQLLFETTKLDGDGSPTEAWNVQFKSQPTQQDAYRWQIEARYINGTEWRGMVYPHKSGPVKSGFLTVIK